MKIGTILKGLVVVFVALVVGVAVYLMSLDFNDYKPEIIAQVKIHTGRDLVIDGDLELEISLTPAIAVSGVKFSNAAWGSRPQMASVERFEARVALLPLISGTVEIQKIVLRGLDLLIETDSKGRANYLFETDKPSSGASKLTENFESDSADAQLPIIHHVAIENAKITYKDGVSGQTHVIDVESLSVQGTGANDPIEIALAAAYNGSPLQAAATLGAPAAFLNPTQPWPLTLSLKAGGADIAVKGTIGQPTTGKNLNLALNISGDQLGDLSKLANAAIPALGAYKISATVTGDPKNSISLSNLAIKIGSSDIGGAVTAVLSGARPRISGTLKSERLDVADFSPAESPAKASESASGSKSAVTAPSAKSDRLFPKDPLPLDGLKAVDADIGLTITKLLAGIAIDDVQVKLGLQNGDLKISTLKAIIANGVVDGNIRLNAAKATPALTVKVGVKGFDAGKMLADLAVTDLLEGAFNAEIDVRGAGDSVASILAGMNGHTAIVMESGKMKSDALDTFIGGPTKFLTELVTGERKEYTVINCAISRIDIKNGLATHKALLFDTDFATISGSGSINLATEALDMKIDPQPKSATINAAVPVLIGGTLANPSYSVDKLAAAQKIGGIVGALVFPPAAILSLGELGTGDANPCLKKASGASKPASAPATKPAPTIAKDPAGAAKDALEKATKGLTGGLKGLFGTK
ncbi:MAG: AsmA family protein [Alphaproteobacteria bacterium]|nr:AsmA family protein [Alphaproteobacteria bacterium]